MLEVADLEVCYGDYQVIWGVSLRVEEGEIVSVLGPNGAGKSTVLNAISGLRPPRSGTIEFEGEPIAGRPPHEIVRRRLVHIMERRRVFPYLTVRQNLWLGGYNPAAREAREATSAPRLRAVPAARRARESARALHERRRAADARPGARPHGSTTAATGRRAAAGAVAGRRAPYVRGAASDQRDRGGNPVHRAERADRAWGSPSGATSWRAAASCWRAARASC